MKHNSLFWRLVLLIWVLMLCAAIIGIAAANAAVPDSLITFYWTNPDSGESCDGATKDSIHIFLGTDVRITTTSGDTTWLPRHLGSKGRPDSISIATPRGTMGTASFFSVNSFSRSCNYASYLFAVPAVEPDTTMPTSQGLSASYWNSSSGDTTTWGQPVVTRIDSTLDFNWGSGSPSPAVNSDNFRARWEGYVAIGIPGTYTFYLGTDDGARMWIDSIWVLSWWGYGNYTEQYFSIDLLEGEHPIRIDYLAGSGNAEAHLRWSGPGITKSVIPSFVLSH